MKKNKKVNRKLKQLQRELRLSVALNDQEGVRRVLKELNLVYRRLFCFQIGLYVIHQD